MDEVPIQFHIDGQGIAVLRVNRPQARNALTWDAQQLFADLVAAVSNDPTIRVLVITGTGDRAFVSGADLKELNHHPERAAGERLNRIMTKALTQLTELPIPVIAAINGDALGGGCEIVTACDLRISTEKARFSFAQVKNGLTTGWDGGLRLVQLIGQSRALELLLTARFFDVEEAMDNGLLHRVVSEQQNVHDVALDWAVELAALPREAMTAIKALVYAAYQKPQQDLTIFAREQFVKLWQTADHTEALAAFQQKRQPVFNQDQPLDTLE